MLARAHERGIRAAFATGDEVCSGRQLRRATRGRGMGYVLAVRASHTLTVGLGRAMTATRARLIPRDAWHRIRTGRGSKSLRHYDWAMLEVTGDDTPGDGRDDGRSVLLVRRRRYTGTLSSCRCWTPGPVPLARLIAVAQGRWKIEEDHQLGKQVAGLDSGQVIRWRSWHRWSAPRLLACTYLAVAVAVDRAAHAGLEIGLIPITIPEMLRCCAAPSSPPRRDHAHPQHWSQWRRRHQYRAS